ncbi:MAG: hypothetical protein RBG13Loki_1579 [Promethearchaeota archaeon CR_4]|nr:MAG: hypothetical protein RBG13Loki_1579 [Candidatus Lokiarchaeota archaeon CR_4]
MGSMIEWFKVKNRQDAIAKTKNHVLKVCDCVVETAKASRFFMEGKTEEGLAVVKRVGELEHDGDEIRRDLLKDLSRGELASAVREDLTHLVKRIDDVAGAANASAKYMSLFTKPMWEKITAAFKDPITKIMVHSGEAAKHLVEMVDDLAGQRLFISELGRQVNSHEHEVDVLHFEIKKLMMNLDMFANQFIAISFVTMIDIMETITDRCEEVADYIILLAVAAK